MFKIRRIASSVFVYDSEPVELPCWIYSGMACSITPSVSLRFLHHTRTQTHQYKTPLLVHLQDNQPWTSPGSIGRNHDFLWRVRAPKTSRQLHLNHMCVSNLTVKGRKATPTAYTKCVCSFYLKLLPTRGLAFAVFSLNEQVLTKSTQKWSVCKDKHPSCTISY